MVNGRGERWRCRPSCAGVVVLLAALSGCAAGVAPPHLPAGAFPGSDGISHRLEEEARRARFTVIVFFGAGCPVQRAHDPRLLEIAARYRPLGVGMLAVDSEASADVASDRREARSRGYPFPILSDPEGTVADALGATYATYTVVVDADGRVRYRGGLDSDRGHLTSGAFLWLRDALDRLLAGREPDPAATHSLGCVLRRR